MSTFLQPLVKEMVDIGSCFIGFRDEAESLRGKVLLHPMLLMFLSCFVPSFFFFVSEALRCVEERANDLEKKLKASEKAGKKAEKKLLMSKIFVKDFKPLICLERQRGQARPTREQHNCLFRDAILLIFE
jgi:hypothetical protein